MARTIAWCTSHYRSEFCKEKAKELRSKGYRVKLGSYVKERGEIYYKIYLLIDLNYEILTLLRTLKIRLQAINYNENRKIDVHDIDNVSRECIDKFKRISINYGTKLESEMEYSFKDKGYFLYITETGSNGSNEFKEFVGEYI